MQELRKILGFNLTFCVLIWYNYDKHTIKVKNMAEKGTKNRRTLAAIESLLAGKTVKDIASYTINNRSLEKMSVEELMRLKSEYTRACLAEVGTPAFRRVTFRG